MTSRVGTRARIANVVASVSALFRSLPSRAGNDDRDIEDRLVLALQSGEIEHVYQPLRRLSNRELLGFEALSRWRLPEGGEISPSTFVPIAHQLGISKQLFRLTLAQAMQDLSVVLRDNRSLYVSLNAEPADMAQDLVVPYIKGMARKFDVLPTQIRIEITEREELTSQVAMSHMEDLSALGYFFLIDDFGTGNANFALLAELPFRGLKIDRMFATAYTDESHLKAVLPGIVHIAAELGLEVIIEGVETAEQELQLRKIAPEATGQGWHYGHPLSADDARNTVSPA